MHSHFDTKFKNLYKEDENGIFEIEQTFIKAAVKCLKEEDGFHFLADITAVDYSKFVKTKPTRFAIVYILRDKEFKNTITLKVYVEEDEGDLHVESISDLFFSANWA